MKTGKFETMDLSGLLEFVRRFPKFKPLVICNADTRATAERAGVLAMTWQEYLLDAPG